MSDTTTSSACKAGTESFDWHAIGQSDDHHALFKPFEGTFRAEVKFWCAPGEPQVTHGTMKNAFVLGGRFLEQVYDGDPSNDDFGPYLGRGYWGFNRITGKYECVWVDNMSTPIMSEVGEVDATGKVWTMTGTYDDPATGERRNKRSVIRIIDDNHHVMESYMHMADGQEMKTMEITHVRA